MVRATDLVTLPGMKKAPKKHVAAMLEPSSEAVEDENGELLAENEDKNSSDAEDMDGVVDGGKLQSELQSLNSNGIKVEMELKDGLNYSAKKKTPVGKGRGGSTSAEKKSAGRGRGGSGPGSSKKAGAKRKR